MIVTMISHRSAPLPFAFFGLIAMLGDHVELFNNHTAWTGETMYVQTAHDGATCESDLNMLYGQESLGDRGNLYGQLQA